MHILFAMPTSVLIPMPRGPLQTTRLEGLQKGHVGLVGPLGHVNISFVTHTNVDISLGKLFKVRYNIKQLITLLTGKIDTIQELVNKCLLIFRIFQIKRANV